MKKMTGNTKSAAARAAAGGPDLASLFNAATQALAANQASLNQADTDNQNHGDHMVEAFKMITSALASQPGGSLSQQLDRASQSLAQNANSGSAQVYSQGLARAAEQLQGQSTVTPDNVMLLIQSLLGGGSQPTSSSGGDLLGTLLGAAGQAMGTPQGMPQGTPQGTPQGVEQPQSGIGLDDLLNAGMAFMSAKQQGQDNLSAALTALMSDGPMAQKPARQESGQLGANAILQALSGISRRG